MKNIFLFLMAAFPLMLFQYSCSKDHNEEASLSVNYDYSQNISENGGSATFNVVANLDWIVSNFDEWVISFEPKQGSGNQTVTVTFGPNNATSTRSSIFVISAGDFKQEVLITQLSGTLPVAAGTISGDDEGFESVTLTIDVIENANTYKWYKNGSEVQNSTERIYIATESGAYTVAGTNDVGEGQSSLEKVVTITTPVLFDDLAEGTFTAIGEPIANVGGYESWDGSVTKKTEGTNQYYIISHWGGSESEYNYNVALLCKDGAFFVDNETLVIYDDQTTPGEIYEGYFYAFFVDANSTMYLIDGFSPLYYKNETTINFSGSYDGYPVYVGIIAQLNGEFAGVFSEIYENARVIITPGNDGKPSIQSVSRTIGENNHLNKRTNIIEFKYGSKIQFDPVKFISE